MTTASAAVILMASCLLIGSMCAVPREIFECQPGVPYLQNGCNECFCIRQSDLVCTARKCLGNQDMEACATGTIWQENCNKCWCTNVGTVCSNYECKLEAS